ncbi:unnamed protein product [Vicia faba]|uniref:Uncharacterized protein n=1 Tax=Vicia faba TaxID=3906 RepID=A0AAV1A107_VICFA|nr:unnamed protein product [Vicia faba]
MIRRISSNYLFFALGFLLSTAIPFANGESSTCLTVYKNGGAPAVFQSPKCPRWRLFDYDSPRQTTTRCQSSMLQGRRKSQEDRTLCVLDVRIPFPGPVGVREVVVGIVAVFDGHNGAEARTLLHRRDHDHVNLLHRWKEILGWQWHELHSERLRNVFSANFDDSIHLEILKEALLRAIRDIDAKFSEEASRNNLHSGSTATVVLVADDKFLVANIGDSKAFLCSENFQSPKEAKASLLKLYRQTERDGSVSVWDREKYRLASSHGLNHFAVKELTRDHHPDREDERTRVEASGGQVLNWGGLPRVNGQLAITRAIGDVLFKSYGVISVPEVTDWQPLTANDSYLVAASDGVFENMDNMAAVVVPLESANSSGNSLRRSYTENGDAGFPLFGMQESAYRSSANDITSGLLHVEHTRLLDTKFKRILVEVKHGDFGCFYLAENLDDSVESKWPAKKDDWEDYLYELPQPLPNDLHQQAEVDGPIILYSDQNFCFYLSSTINEAKDQCINPEGFASFIGLLGSIPLHDTGSDNSSSDYSMPDSRYILRRSFGRGSYGEVWLAFHWNCNQDNITAEMSTGDNSRNRSSSSSECLDGPSNYTLYILKRIMVEKGSAVYLSGLREKYFGEIFLNASMCFGDVLLAGKSNCVFETSQQYGSEYSFQDKFRLQGAIYEEGLNHIARYVESFESRSNEIWLVFSYEGVSLSKLLYTAEDANNTAEKEKLEQVKQVQILHPSKWWRWLKTTEEGQEEMRNLIWQLLLALKSCHDRNITHRDIKPGKTWG